MTMLGFTSCDSDDHLTDSTLTYYVVLDMQGESFVQVPIGTTYNDAGCKATLQGEDYTSNIVTEGLDDIDVNTAGLYYVTYSATNADGYSVSVTRTVAVCDPTITTDISGSWTGQAGTYRVYYYEDGTTATTNFPGFSISIEQAAPGIFYISDYFGGYYDQRAGYGSSYAMYGYLQLLADGTLVSLSSHVNGWGDSVDDFQGTYDAATGTIDLYMTYADSMEFFIKLNQE